jgi:hypothetical protein
VLVVAVGLVVAVVWAMPLWVDARRAYRLRERAVHQLGTCLSSTESACR